MNDGNCYKEEGDILAAVGRASRRWKDAFNSGDAAGCAACYEPGAVMTAQAFGTYRGTAEIQGFWQNLIDDGFRQVEYIDPRVVRINHSSAVLTAKWSMNKAQGVIHRELWILQPDGEARLREDDFEAQP